MFDFDTTMMALVGFLIYKSPEIIRTYMSYRLKIEQMKLGFMPLCCLKCGKQMLPRADGQGFVCPSHCDEKEIDEPKIKIGDRITAAMDAWNGWGNEEEEEEEEDWDEEEPLTLAEVLDYMHDAARDSLARAMQIDKTANSVDQLTVRETTSA